METFYLVIVVLLFILAVFDLSVGVSNDAVNFLNSALGSKAASFKTILCIAALGIVVGASLSNGMMDVARHGIFQPQHFTFSEIMCILLAVMLTDVVLLDIFNSLGMPTSTTVSLVFELLGGTFVLALLKIASSGGMYQIGDLLNTDKALSVILAIFVSVAVAFFFGTLVQFVSRLLFTFNYKKNMKYAVGLFGGAAATAILYFMLIKGLKESSFMSGEAGAWIHANTTWLVIGCFVVSTVGMQVLHWLKINVLKIIVLLGTFALALAFAGNDLVNFIGVPLVGYSSFTDYAAQGGTTTTDTFLMTSLLGPARTPWYFLVGAGLIMVVALFTSKKAHHVVKTSLDLSRQEAGEEGFGTSPVARVLVRTCNSAAASLLSVVPGRVKNWVDSRFRPDEAVLENGAAFDLVRAAVNLVVAGLLIALGTSLKLPLSTTYVAFMVAMGSSLADRAWGRDSAVYRITGVLSVIGGWFITAGAAFTICMLVTLLIYYGSLPAMVALVGLALFILVKSQLAYKKKVAKEKNDTTVQQLVAAQGNDETMELLRSYARQSMGDVLSFAGHTLEKTATAFMEENYRSLRKAMNAVQEEKKQIKRIKRIAMLGVSRLENNTALEKGLYYYQSNDFLGETVYCLARMCEPCLEHIANNFNPLQAEQKEEFSLIAEPVARFAVETAGWLRDNDYSDYRERVNQADELINKLAGLKRNELKRIQGTSASIKVSLVYLTLIQETQNLVAYTSNLIKVSRKFQEE